MDRLRALCSGRPMRVLAARLAGAWRQPAPEVALALPESYRARLAGPAAAGWLPESVPAPMRGPGELPMGALGGLPLPLEMMDYDEEALAAHR